MNPFWILLIAMAIVIGGVLVLRLHAFLALIVGALIVALLTPASSVYQNEIHTAGIPVPTADDGDNYLLKAGKNQKIIAGLNDIFRKDDPGGGYQKVASVALEVVEKNEQGTRVILQSDDDQFHLQRGDLVVHHTISAQAEKTARQSIGERVAEGFGSTCLKIGILIAMAAIIGKCLLDSGAAERVVVSARRAVGDERTPLAFLASGFIIGIPVFFDTVFYLLMPLGKAMRVRTGKNYLLYVLSIVAGGTMAHSLVPPTPGPLFVASELGVDLGLMILGGSAVGIFTAASGYLFALWANRRWEIPLRESAELTAEELEAMAHRDESTLPALWLSLAPILLPVILIAGKTVIDMMFQSVPTAEQPAWLTSARPWINVLGNKNIALVIAAAVALVTLARQKHATRAEMAAAVQNALAGGGVIILITAAGGAFGHVLRQTGISGHIQQMVPESQASLLLVAFLITTVVRIAQGSATVAMITAVGIVGPLASSGGLGYSPMYLALAIGCGSKPIPWMNDSGFWVISKMSGMTEAEMLKTVTIMGSLMGVVGLVVTLIAAALFPLV